MIGPRCYGQTLHMSQSILTVNSNVSRIITGFANRLYYSKDKDQKACCENVPQTASKQVEPWPKPDRPPPMWRCECPQEPQPPNYDPYRIKVPDVVVPPLPPTNAKWSGVVSMTSEHDDPARQQRQQHEVPPYQNQYGPHLDDTPEEATPYTDAGELYNNAEMNFQSDSQSYACRVRDLFQNSPFVHPDYWKDKQVKKISEVVKEVLPKLGYHGRNKYKYAFHEPWRPLDRLGLLEQAEKQEHEQSDETSGDKVHATKQTS